MKAMYLICFGNIWNMFWAYHKVKSTVLTLYLWIEFHIGRFNVIQLCQTLQLHGYLWHRPDSFRKQSYRDKEEGHGQRD